MIHHLLPAPSFRCGYYLVSCVAFCCDEYEARLLLPWTHCADLGVVTESLCAMWRVRAEDTLLWHSKTCPSTTLKSNGLILEVRLCVQMCMFVVCMFVHVYVCMYVCMCIYVCSFMCAVYVNYPSITLSMGIHHFYVFRHG